MEKFAIKLTKVSKKFTLHHEKPTLVENILLRRTKERFWALKDVDLTINKGERIGIIGPNGSGKTTLLEIIAGITTPTSGKVVTKGKIVSLIELSAGFHPDLTGEENIYLNSLLIGMSKDEIKSKIRKIVSFADIGQFIDTPMYTYSEGMKLRLGFAILAYSNPDILLFDEQLAIGDRDFREKSFNKIQEFFSQGKTIIMASHLLEFLKDRADRVIWLDKGRIKKEGASKQVIKEYRRGLDS